MTHTKGNTTYDESPHTKIEMQNLILLGIYSVLRNGEVCTFERLVAECFTKFPKVFGFKRYPQWPDSLKFDRPLRTLRQNGLIVGGARSHFQLTQSGESVAKQVESELRSGACVTHKKAKPEGRSTDDRLIWYLKNSDQFKRYVNDPDSFAITEPEFRSMLRCTLETPERIVRQNLTYYKKLAQNYGESQLLHFLTCCEKMCFGEESRNG